jgi:hypothetical protein
MSKFKDTGNLKITISNLFRAELGYIKSVNLAGGMVTRYFDSSLGENHDQKAIFILIAAAKNILCTFPPSTEIMTYLWCHQRVTSKRGRVFFSIGTKAFERIDAYGWYLRKAADLAEMTRQVRFLENLMPVASCLREASDQGLAYA